MPLPGSHPLHVAGGHFALVAETVAVLNRPGEHVGNRFDPAVRMPGKTRFVIRWILVAEIVQQQKGSNSLVLPKPKARCSFTPAPSIVGCV